MSSISTGIIDIKQILTPSVLEHITNSITERLTLKYPCLASDKEETQGWAQLGIARAITQYDQQIVDKIDVRDPVKWLCGYLNTMGYYRAVDELRHAGVISRYRNSGETLSGGPLETLPFAELETDNGDKDVMGVVDPGTHHTVEIEFKDMVEAVKRKMNHLEQQVFEKRYQVGLRFSEIAALLRIPAPKVYATHARIMTMIRDYVAKESAECPIRTLAAA